MIGNKRRNNGSPFANRFVRRDRVIRLPIWLAGILIVAILPSAFAQTDFPVFWKKFSSAVIAGDKATVADMTAFPLSTPAFQKPINDKEDFLRRYDEVFNGEADAAQCFKSAGPEKDSTGSYEIYCPFKDTPDDEENAPIRFVFELTKTGWKFTGLDNINE